MSNLPELYKKLEEYSNFDQDNNCEKFLDTVDEIFLLKDSSSIQVLLKYFDDQTEYGWILETISGTIECYPREDYIINLLLNFEHMTKNAKNWLKSLVFHILNSPEDLKYFRSYIKIVSEKLLLELFRTMQQESPRHKELIEELIQQFETS